MKSTPEYGLQYPEGTDRLETYPTLAKANAENLESILLGFSESVGENPYKGSVPSSTTSLSDLEPGWWGIPNGATALAVGLPLSAVYTLAISETGNVRTALAIKREDGNGPAKIFVSSSTSGDWTDWQEQANMSETWYQGSLSTGSADDAPNGVVSIWSGTAADTLELPARSYGILMTIRYGSQGWQVFHALAAGETWKRLKFSYGWGPWTQDGPHDTIVPNRASTTPAGLKIVPMPLTLGKGGSTGSPANGSYRLPVKFNAPITRWRVCFSLRSPRYSKIHNTTAVITELAIGPHAGDGKFSSPPRRILRDLAIPTDGTPGVTAWQTTTLGDGANRLLSYTYTSTGAETPPENYGASWGAGNATAVEVSPATTYGNHTPFDIWIEAETYATTPVIAAVGDSLVCGANATLSVHDSWANVYARSLGGLATLYGTSGDTGASWISDEDAYKVSRFNQPHLATPDTVIWAMGRNDFNSTQTMEMMIATTTAAADIISRRIGPAVYAVTITPRDSGVGDAARAEYNDWLLAEGRLFRDVFDFSGAVSAPGGGILPEFNADGLHLNSSGYAALAAKISRPISAPPVQYVESKNGDTVYLSGTVSGGVTGYVTLTPVPAGWSAYSHPSEPGLYRIEAYCDNTSSVRIGLRAGAGHPLVETKLSIGHVATTGWLSPQRGYYINGDSTSTGITVSLTPLF